MATCIHFEASQGRLFAPVSATGKTVIAWSAGDATYSGGQYACADGSHLVMSVQEVNASQTTGVPDASLMRETFFLSFGLVVSCWVLGKFVGAVLELIKGKQNDY